MAVSSSGSTRGAGRKGLAFSNPDPTKFGVLPWLYMSLGLAM